MPDGWRPEGLGAVGPEKECRHLSSGDKGIGTEESIGRRLAAQGNSGRCQNVDGFLEDRAVIVDEEIGPDTGPKVQGSCQERRHLSASDEVVRAKRCVRGRRTAEGDSGGCELVDRILEDRTIIVDEQVPAAVVGVALGPDDEGGHLTPRHEIVGTEEQPQGVLYSRR